jgi:hypothetical protein
MQTLVLFELNATVRPELAVALRGGGENPSTWLLNGPKVMVWEVVPEPETVKV